MMTPNFDDLAIFLIVCCVALCVISFGLGVFACYYFLV